MILTFTSASETTAALSSNRDRIYTQHPVALATYHLPLTTYHLPPPQVLESALTKARSGDVRTSRKALRYLIKHVPWYGPLYQEALRLEEKSERPHAALKIVHLGLKETPRSGRERRRGG